MLGEDEFSRHDGLFKVWPQTAIQQGGCSFAERERRVSSLKSVACVREAEGGTRRRRKERG